MPGSHVDKAKRAGRSARAARGPQGPDLAIEQERAALFRGPIAGVDEAGRGPWAGPVVAAAVILDQSAIPEGIDDSKRLTATARERLFDAIMARARVGIGIADVQRIDRDNVLNATFWAMREAVAGLGVRPSLALVDGNVAPELGCDCEAVICGDARSLSIAAASIIAKVTRDRIMADLAHVCPGYGFERHKGYGTPEHARAIAALGVSPHHRRSFAPVRQALANTALRKNLATTAN